MEHLATISHNSYSRYKSRSPSSPYGPSPQGSQLISLGRPLFGPEKQLKNILLDLIKTTILYTKKLPKKIISFFYNLLLDSIYKFSKSIL